MESLLQSRGLHTVCESALCPNLGECFGNGTAAFLIMGDVCSRNCGFCAVKHGERGPLDPDEPTKVAEAAVLLALRHVVVTSVTRDDLPDGGAGHYARTIRALRERIPGVSLEVLVPDFLGHLRPLDVVLDEQPEVFSHNLETVPRLYAGIRPHAAYGRSVEVLRRAADRSKSVVKTGLMVGLGETEGEVRGVLDELVTVGVMVVTIGQYLPPSESHARVVEYVLPEVFERYRGYGEVLGLQVHAAPFARSSFHAGESYSEAVKRGERERAERS